MHIYITLNLVFVQQRIKKLAFKVLILFGLDVFTIELNLFVICIALQLNYLSYTCFCNL